MRRLSIILILCIICVSDSKAYKNEYTVIQWFPDYIINAELSPVIKDNAIEKWKIILWIHWDFQVGASGCTDCSWMQTDTDILQFSPRNRCYDADNPWDAEYRSTWTLEADDFLHAQQIMFAKSHEMLKRMSVLNKSATVDYKPIVFTNYDGIKLIDLTDGNIPIGGY